VGDLADIGRGALAGAGIGAITGGVLGAVDYFNWLEKSLYIKKLSALDVSGGNTKGDILRTLLKFVGFGSDVSKAAFVISPNVDALLFSTLPPIITYGVGYGVGEYYLEHPDKIKFNIKKKWQF